LSVQSREFSSPEEKGPLLLRTICSGHRSFQLSTSLRTGFKRMVQFFHFPPDRKTVDIKRQAGYQQTENKNEEKENGYLK
jgi:hypothetical protein